ncbi:hypothetical protein Hdeb2414_s0009g00311771 [Helianthus debilis subsp. tardiflorus]
MGYSIPSHIDVFHGISHDHQEVESTNESLLYVVDEMMYEYATYSFISSIMYVKT